MKLYLFTSIILIIFFIKCSDQGDSKNQIVHYNPTVKLTLTDSLQFLNNDSSFIGAIRAIKVINNRIYISDKSLAKIHIFDNRLNYLTSIGSYGKGPGEFVDAPDLVSIKDTLVAFNTYKYKLYFYDSNHRLAKIVELPEDYIYMKTAPVFINSKIAIAATNVVMRDLNQGIDDYKTVLMLNENGTVFKNFCMLDKLYEENKDNLFFARNNYSIISEGFNNLLAVHQLATTKLLFYDSNGTFKYSLEYKPRFYIDPPEIKANRQFKSMEEAMKVFYSKKTYFSRMFFDPTTNLLYINYRKLNENQYQTRSFLDAENYLFIINKDNNCIFDERIPGYIADVNKGSLYLVSTESDNELEMKIFKIDKSL